MEQQWQSDISHTAICFASCMFRDSLYELGIQLDSSPSQQQLDGHNSLSAITTRRNAEKQQQQENIARAEVCHTGKQYPYLFFV
jgi:hypothetical protein